jgi:hypothetical protein
MELTMSKREFFDSCAGFVLGKLDGEHPERMHLIPREIVIELGGEVSDEKVRLCFLTIEWLEDNGYIGCYPRRFVDSLDSFRGARLTDKGLVALDRKIDFRGKSKRLGDALVEQVGTVAGETRNSIIGELVGQVIGGVIKSFSGS